METLEAGTFFGGDVNFSSTRWSSARNFSSSPKSSHKSVNDYNKLQNLAPKSIFWLEYRVRLKLARKVDIEVARPFLKDLT
jgi:hypothetical protein